jgi:hypothetical protein
MCTRSDGSISTTLGVDARFPNVNQTKHCWQNYVDYHKCIIAKGEDFAPCRQVSQPVPAVSCQRSMLWELWLLSIWVLTVLARLSVPMPQWMV